MDNKKDFKKKKKKRKNNQKILVGMIVFLSAILVGMLWFLHSQSTHKENPENESTGAHEQQQESLAGEENMNSHTDPQGFEDEKDETSVSSPENSEDENSDHGEEGIIVVDVYIKEINGELHLIKVLSDGTVIDEGCIAIADDDKPDETFTVTFMNYDGSILKSEEVKQGMSATPPASPTRDGYTFIGWSGSYCKVTVDITVVAQYQINDPEIVAYTVRFVDYDGTVLKTQPVEKGQAATAPVAPTRDGYNFIGWDRDFGNVTSDLTVTALYEEIPSTEPIIRISDVGGSPGDEIEVTFTLANCPELYSLRFALAFDNEALTLISTTSGDSMAGFTYQKPSQLKSGCAFMWYANDLTDGSGIVLKLVFKVSENAQPGNYQLTLTCDSSNTYGDGDDLMIGTKGGRVTVAG